MSESWRTQSFTPADICIEYFLWIFSSPLGVQPPLMLTQAPVSESTLISPHVIGPQI